MDDDKYVGSNGLFGSYSQDLCEESKDGIKTPISVKKRPNLSSPFSNKLLSPLSSTLCNSVQGIYCSQEIRDFDDNPLKGDVWGAVKSFQKQEQFSIYKIKSVLNGSALYHGKVAHLAVLVKSVERISSKDCSLILHDDSGEIKAAVHKRVMDKYGAFIEPGSGLLLRQCTVFSFISIQKYVNITLPNIVHIFNTSSLEVPPAVIQKHITEVSEINVQRVDNPDTENQTPVIHTPNRPPPPRSSTSSIQNTPLLTTPQRQNPRCSNSSREQNGKQQTKQQRSCYTNSPQPGSSEQQPGPSCHLKSTSDNSWTPNSTRDLQNGSSSSSNFSSGKSINLASASTPSSIKRSFNPYQSSEAKKAKVDDQPTPKTAVLSPKEQEEISKLLEDIDDSFFDVF